MNDFFTAEERAKLVGFLALNNEPFDFTPEEFMFLPEDKRPVFTIQEFNNKAQQKLIKLGLKLEGGDSIHIMLKVCVLGWRNYRTLAGVEIPFAAGAEDAPTDDCIAAMGKSTQLSILNRINGE